jgi:hypothetical protein
VLHSQSLSRCVRVIKLTAGVVVFSVGVSEGSPQASRPTGPAEHACIVFHIHIVSICGRGEHRYVAPCPLRKSDESPRAPSRVVVVVSHPPFPGGVSEALGGRRVRNTITSQTEPNRAL